MAAGDIPMLSDEEFAALGGVTVRFDLTAGGRPAASIRAAEPLSAAAVVLQAAGDPLDSNCKGVAVDGNGKVVGIRCEYAPVADQVYDLELAKLIDENAAQGNHVFMWDVLDGAGGQAPENVWMAWPWPENQFRALPGNPNRQHEMTSKFPGDGRVGPLFFYPGDAAGRPIGAILAGGGLLEGRHYCLYVRWRKVGSAPPDGGGDEPAPDDATLPGAVQELAAAVRAQSGILSQIFHL